MDRKNVMAKRPRGTGCLYQQPGSEIWWVQFHRNGQRFRKSAGTDNKRKAQDYLRDKIAEASLGTYSPLASRVTVAELVEAKLSLDRANALRDAAHAGRRWKLHLQHALGHLKAASLSTPILSKYVGQRRAEGASPATVNRELALLRAAFNLARKSNLVRTVPWFPMLAENNARKGFLRDDQYAKLVKECGRAGLWLRSLFEVAYTYGWRRGELVGLKCRQVDLAARTIRLFDSKNHCGRVVVMMENVYALLSACVARKGEDDFVFTWPDGRPVKDFRATWTKVTKAAGCPGLLLHDLRRTGVRNLRRLGVAESVAMRISGHKTAAVFRRYDITDEADLAEAAKLLDAKARMAENQFGHSLAIVEAVHGQDVTKPVN
jgi:integrase